MAGGAFVPPDWAMGTTWWRDDLRDIWNIRSANGMYGQDRTPWDIPASGVNDPDQDYDQELIGIVRDYATTHHELIPYVRSFLYQATQTGVGVMRPMFFEFPNEGGLGHMWDQYMYGDALLVAPIVSGEGVLSRSVYLPEGEWMDYNDRTSVYSGGQTISLNGVSLDTVPVFVKVGSILMRGDVLKANNNWTPNWAPTLQIEAFVRRVNGPMDHAASTCIPYIHRSVSPL